MLVARYLSIFLCAELCYGQVTLKQNRLLSRKRRFLLFPEGTTAAELNVAFIPSTPGMNVNQKVLILETGLKRALEFSQEGLLQTTMSFVKAVMIQVPKLINVLGECDVPFKLPSDPGTFRTKKLQHRIHYRQRREVYSQLEEALTQHGLDGNACVKRMICDVQRYIPLKGKSLVGDILSTIFTFSEDEVFDDGDKKYHNCCHNATYINCQLPLLDYIIGSLIKQI